jgi:hypothetical protein
MQLMQNVTRAVVAYDRALRGDDREPRGDDDAKPDDETGGTTY